MKNITIYNHRIPQSCLCMLLIAGLVEEASSKMVDSQKK